MRNIHTSFIDTLEQLQQTSPSPAKLVTMESIAFQNNDDFGPRIEEICAKYKAMIDSGVNRRVVDNAVELRKQLEDLIFSRLKVKVVMVVNGYIAATIPNVYVPHNPVIRDDIRWVYEQVEDISGQDKLSRLKNNTVIGSVDTKTAKVSGWFSNQVCPLFINFYDLIKKYDLSVPEVTAIILHELGHVFQGIVYCANINTTNQVLADIARNISKPGYSDTTYIYNRIREVYPGATKDMAESLCSGKSVVMNIALYRLVTGSTRSLMQDKAYDKTGYEALSDQFSTRFGYGLHLVTGLEKFESVYSEYEGGEYVYGEVKKVMIVAGLLSVLSFACMVIPNPAIKLVSALVGIIFGFIVKSAVDTQRTSAKEMTYDNIRDRYKRIRNQIVELIKSPDLSTDVKTALLNEISAIDLVLNNKEVFSSSMEKFFIRWNSNDRLSAQDIALQRELEDMIANDIFVSANRLMASKA